MVEYIVAVLKFMVHMTVRVYTTLSYKGVIKNLYHNGNY